MVPRPAQPKRPADPSFVWLVFLFLAFGMGLLTGYLVWGRSSQTASAAADPVQPAASGETRRYDIPLDDDPTLGPADAPITLVEFSDYECVYCQKWEQTVWPQIAAAYGDKIRLVYRDYLLYGLPPNEAGPAEAADCAGEQDAYWPYHDQLYGSGLRFSVQSYQKIADTLKLDRAAFDECLTSLRYRDEVLADNDFATGLGIDSTPVFFVNGIPLVGALPFSTFQQVIDQELAAVAAR